MKKTRYTISHVREWLDSKIRYNEETDEEYGLYLEIIEDSQQAIENNRTLISKIIKKMKRESNELGG